jgi:hypothetical protein
VRATSLALALAFLPPVGARDEPPEAPGWQPFAGNWSATGRRQVLEVEGGGRAVVVIVSGAVVLTDPGGLSRGFHGQAIGFDDGFGLSVGRCVWTDENGDRVFSRLQGERLETGRSFQGTITGGTGRYTSLEGEYSFTWQYVVAAEDDRLSGRAVGLAGRARRAAAPR